MSEKFPVPPESEWGPKPEVNTCMDAPMILRGQERKRKMMEDAEKRANENKEDSNRGVRVNSNPDEVQI